MRWTLLGTLAVALAGSCAAQGGPDRAELNTLKGELRQALVASKLDEAVAKVKTISTADSKLGALILLGLAHNNTPSPVYDAACEGLATMTAPDVGSMFTRKCQRGRPEEQLMITDALAIRAGSFAELNLTALLQNSPDPRVQRGALVALQRAKLSDAQTAIATWIEQAQPTQPILLATSILHAFSEGKAGEAAPGPSCAGAPILGNHVVFAVDVSAPMGEEGRLDTAKALLLESIQALGPEQRFTILAFSGHTLEGLAEPPLVKQAYPETVDGVTWLRALGPRVEFARDLWLDKAKAFVEGLEPAGDDAFALRALEAAVRVPVADAVVLITSGRFTDVDHTASARHTAESFLAAFRAANRPTRLVIDVRTFAADPTLEELAASTGGTYVELK